MNKKIILIIACLFLMCSTVMAAPLNDYSTGKISIDLNYRNTQNTVSNNKGGSADYPKKYSFEPSITVGINGKTALQYRNTNAKSGIFDWGGGSYNSLKLTMDEFNLLYRLSPKISAFAGYVSAKQSFDGGSPGYSGNESRKKDFCQIGLIGMVPLNDKFTAYGVASAGNKYTNYTIGISYALNKNLELNLDYRALKIKGFDWDSYHEKQDVNVSGLGFGVTCKF